MERERESEIATVYQLYIILSWEDYGRYQGFPLKYETAAARQSNAASRTKPAVLLGLCLYFGFLKRTVGRLWYILIIYLNAAILYLKKNNQLQQKTIKKTLLEKHPPRHVVEVHGGFGCDTLRSQIVNQL